MKYFVLHLGCQMNISDGERVETVLDGLGFEKTENEAEAQLLGIIACSVRQRAIDKVYSRISKWNKRKDSSNMLTFLSGCVLDSDKKKFLKLFDLVFSMTDLVTLPDMIRQSGITTPLALQLDHSNPQLDFWNIEPHHNSPFQAYVPIQNGCDKFCTYCAVPYTRGREISRPSTEIYAEVEALINNGFKSITLLGQNVNSYGLDKKSSEPGFVELLEEIGKIGKNAKEKSWIYFTSPHPSDMNRHVFEVIADYECLGKQVHLPLQSGDEEILKAMNRSYSIEDFRKIVLDIRSIIPTATLFTDIIVGFPGETEAQFENTRKAVEEFAFNMAYVAAYSPRPGSISTKLKDDILAHEKKRRLQILSVEFKKSALAYNQDLIGKTIPVLVEGSDRKEGYFCGKTEGLGIVQFQSNNKKLIGSFVNVKIQQVTPMAMAGDLV